MDLKAHRQVPVRSEASHPSLVVMTLWPPHHMVAAFEGKQTHAQSPDRPDSIGDDCASAKTTPTAQVKRAYERLEREIPFTPPGRPPLITLKVRDRCACCRTLVCTCTCQGILSLKCAIRERRSHLALEQRTSDIKPLLTVFIAWKILLRRYPRIDSYVCRVG